MSMKAPPPRLLPELETRVSVGQARSADPACVAFVADALGHSGLDYRGIDITGAEYRLQQIDGSLRSGLRFEAMVNINGETALLRRFVEPQLAYHPQELMQAIWSLESFPALRRFLKELRTLTRYTYEGRGRLIAQVMPVGLVLRLVDYIERDELVTNQGQPTMEAVTRHFGLRRKLLLLDFHRRQALLRKQGDSIQDLMTRTLDGR